MILRRIVSARRWPIPALLVVLTASCAHESRSAAELRTASVAGAARAQLTELAAPPVVRRVWSHASNMIDSYGARPSPDGQYLLATDWSSGDLVALDFANNTVHSITGKKSWAESDQYAYGAAYAPDGKTVVYTWFFGIDNTELRAIPVAGPDSGKARTVFRHEDINYYQPILAPDNRTVVALVQRRDRVTQIISVPLGGGQMRVLKTFDWRYPQNLAISPDGRWLAYDFPPEEHKPARDVYVLALDGSRESAVVRSAMHEVVAGWSPDGRYLLYASEVKGTPASLFALPLAEGKPGGPPLLVRSDIWRMFPLGTAVNGRFIYLVETGRRDVFTAALDSRDGTVVSEPVSASASAADALPWGIAFSPDGQYVAYRASRGPVLGSGLSDIVIRGLDRGEVRRISPRLTQIGTMLWMTDPRALLMSGLDEKRKRVIARVDLDSGEMAAVDQPEDAGQFVAIAPDGQRMYFTAMDSTGRTMRVFSFNMMTRDQTLLHTMSDQAWPAGIALSPDGRELAVLARPRNAPASVTLVPVAGGPVRTVYTLPEGRVMSPAARGDWSPDGRYIYFAQADAPAPGAGEPTAELWRLDVVTGSAKPAGLQAVGLARLRVSPDGRRIGFGIGNFASEIWVMEPPQLPAATQKVGTLRR